MESSRQIEQRAGEWLLKRESAEWSDADQAQLTAWLDATIAHRVAFLRLEAAWEETGRLKALGTGFPRGKVPSAQELEIPPLPLAPDDPERGKGEAEEVAGMPFRRGRRFGLAALAATMALSVTGIYLYNVRPFDGDRYSTPVGGLASVPLKDGSHITLNTASRLSVQLSETERHIEIAQGEAFFEVAKDPSRPFVVEAGRKRIIAVGTKFSVRRDGNDVQVAVTEGVVRFEDMESDESAAGIHDSGPIASSRLSAGAVARARDADVMIEQRPVPEVEEFLSWRSGFVVFHDTTLADAVAEFNRYNARKIVIEDAATGGIRLTGKFRANNNETFVHLLEQTFHIRAESTADQIVLSDGAVKTR